MKALKTIVAGTLALSVFAGAGAAYAETTTATTTAQWAIEIQSLMKQISDLNAQIFSLRSKQNELSTDLRAAIKADLKQGMTNDEVKALQEILATDPTLFSSANITGHFGPLTAAAVKKFQKAHGLEQVGVVGPKTKAVLNALLDDDDFRCNAWGHLKGSNGKVVGKFNIDISKCDNVPPGIAKKMGEEWWKKFASSTKGNKGKDKDGNATSTKDLVAPALSSIAASTTSSTTATVKWNTNEFATGAVWYGTTTSDLKLGPSTTLFSLAHSHMLAGLAASTTYSYRVVSKDVWGNAATSSAQVFTTF